MRKYMKPSSRKSTLAILAVLAMLFLMTGCASQPSREFGDAPGFFMGLWHGYIALVAVFVGLFTDIRIYNFPNSGYWYDVGFVIGFFGFIGTLAQQ